MKKELTIIAVQPDLPFLDVYDRLIFYGIQPACNYEFGKSRLILIGTDYTSNSVKHLPELPNVEKAIRMAREINNDYKTDEEISYVALFQAAEPEPTKMTVQDWTAGGTELPNLIYINSYEALWINAESTELCLVNLPNPKQNLRDMLEALMKNAGMPSLFGWNKISPDDWYNRLGAYLELAKSLTPKSPDSIGTTISFYKNGLLVFLIKDTSKWYPAFNECDEEGIAKFYEAHADLKGAYAVDNYGDHLSDWEYKPESDDDNG